MKFKQNQAWGYILIKLNCKSIEDKCNVMKFKQSQVWSNVLIKLSVEINYKSIQINSQAWGIY